MSTGDWDRMTLQEFGMLLLRRWWMVAIAVVIGAGAGFAYESSQPTVVSTNGRLLIGPALEGDNQIDSTGQLSRSTLQQTLAEITTGSEVTQNARAEVDNTSSAYAVSAVVIPETNVVKVTVDGRTPERTIELTTAIMSHAESVFETRYPVYDVAVVDEPLNAPKVAPDPEFGLVMGGLLGAVGAAIIVAASAGARVGTPVRRRRRDVVDEPVARARRRPEPALDVGAPPVEIERDAEDEPFVDRYDDPEGYDPEPYGDPEGYDPEPYDDREPYGNERYDPEPYDDTESSPRDIPESAPVERAEQSAGETTAGGSTSPRPEPSQPDATRPAAENPSPDATTRRDVDHNPSTSDDADHVAKQPIPLPPSREEVATARPGRHLADDDSEPEASSADQVDLAIEGRLPDWITHDWTNLSASDGPRPGDSDPLSE